MASNRLIIRQCCLAKVYISNLLRLVIHISDLTHVSLKKRLSQLSCYRRNGIKKQSRARMEQLLGYAMMLTVPWALWKNWSLRQQVKAADSWPCTDGEILSSGIGSSSSGNYDTPNTMYQAKVVYEYEAGGRRRENNRICVGGQIQLSLKSKANEYCARYPQGKKVIVHYNPRKPEDSVLEVKEETSWVYLVGAAVLFIVGYNFI